MSLIKLITIVLIPLAILGCGQTVKTTVLRSNASVEKGFKLRAELKEGFLLSVTELGGVKPVNCQLDYNSEIDPILKRNFIKVSAIRCATQRIELKGTAVSNDGNLGLRVDPIDNTVIEKDRAFSVLVEEKQSLGHLSLKYYGDDSSNTFLNKNKQPQYPIGYTTTITEDTWGVVAEKTIIIFVNSTNVIQKGDSCYLMAGGTLTVVKNEPEVVRYNYHGDTRGTPCETNTLIFYDENIKTN